MLKSEDIFLSKRGVSKFIRNIRNLLVCSCWASSSKTRERNNTHDIRACVYSPVPENGNGEIKMKRDYVRNGPFCSSPVQLPFNTRSPLVFFKRAPVVRNERGNFFLTPTVHPYTHVRTSIHPSIHPYIHTSYKHTHIPHTPIHTYIYPYIHTPIHVHTYTHTYLYPYIPHTPIHTYIHTPIHTYTHTYIHPYIHTPIHTYTHTYIQ